MSHLTRDYRACAQGVTREELLLEGESALLHAAACFDAAKGARLTTYAWFHIMKALTEVVQRVRGQKTPLHVALCCRLRQHDGICCLGSLQASAASCACTVLRVTSSAGMPIRYAWACMMPVGRLL